MLDIEHLTVDNLNELSAGQASLVLLRILNTSDLSFFHSLFKKETLEDILSITDDMVRMETEEGLFDMAKEYLEEREQIQDEIDQQIANPRAPKTKTFTKEHELRIAEMEAEAEQEDPEYDANGEPNDGYIDGRKGF